MAEKRLLFFKNWFNLMTIDEGNMFWRRKKEKKKRAPGEKRKEPRQADSSEIVLEYEDLEGLAPGKKIYYARAKDASPGGLRILSEIPFPVGFVFDIKLKSHRTGKSIEARGRVKWSTSPPPGKAYEIGVEFIETPIRSIMDLLEHIYKG